MNPLRRAWSRRWVRRITYLVAAGGLVTGLTTWTLNQPFSNRWVVQRLAKVVLDETGLPLTADHLELDPIRGHFALRRPTWGGDFFQADRVEIDLDPRSLFGRRWRIYAVRVERPRLVLDQARLDRIRLKPRPKAQAKTDVLLDYLRIAEGRVEIREPRWGLPEATFHFKTQGTGLGANHVLAFLDVYKADVRLASGREAGHFTFLADLSEERLEVKQAEASLGPAQLKASGRLEFKPGRFEVEAEGRTELARTLNWIAGGSRAPLGLVTFKGKAQGTPERPEWNLILQAPQLRPPTAAFSQGSFRLQAKGGLDRATIEALTWESPDGQLALEGAWLKGRSSELQLSLEHLDLNALAAWAKVDSLRDLRGHFEGEVEVPGDPWNLPRWDKVRLKAKGALDRFGQPMGELDLDVLDGQVDLHSLNLRLDALQVDGSASARLDRKGLASLTAKGFAFTDAARVSDTLKAWKVADLDMAGHVQAQADDVRWSREEGLVLLAKADVTGPRWHEASTDRITAGVQILGNRLTVTNIETKRGEGRAFGELWLTWGDVATGADQIDMCYRADRLPITQGLAAADLELPLTGLASGWARIHGRFDRLVIDGEALVQDGKAYGLTVPALSGAFQLDLEGNRLHIPEFRIAGDLDHLDPEAETPTGPLALKGELDMDLARETWQGSLQGAVDTELLGLGGPRVQAQLTSRLAGPWVQPLGPWPLPLGSAQVQRGRVFLGDQSLEDLEGSITLQPGQIDGEVGIQGKPNRLLKLHGVSQDQTLWGAVTVQLDDLSLDASALARRATHDLLQAGAVVAHAQGVWNPSGLTWTGAIDTLWGRFAGFDLTQTRPSTLRGTLAGAQVDMALEGQSRAIGGLSKPGEAVLRIAGEVPFSSAPGLNVRAQGQAQVATLKGMLDLLLDVDENSLLHELRPEGEARVDLTVTGGFGDPNLQGFADLTRGRLQIRTYPQSIEDLTFRVAFQGKDILIDSERPLNGRLAQGTLKATGKATWQLGGLASYDVKASLQDFQLRDIPGIEGLDMAGHLEARLSGNDEEGGLLKGTLVADRATYKADLRLTDLLLNNSLATSRGLEVDDPLARINLDLDLVLAQPWYFDTNLLKMEGHPEGAFKVQGNLLNPGLKGKMLLVPGGRVTNLLPAGDIVLERGTLDFTDPYRVNPIFNFQGRVDVPPYLVNLSLNGNLDQFNFGATSTPSLRQDEVIAILVDPTLAPTIGTGNSTSQSTLNFGIASAGAGILTSSALAAFQESLRRTFNLDRANVAFRSSTGVTETSLTLGKTIDLFGRRIPVIANYRKAGDVVTLGGQLEISSGNWVIQVGASGTEANDINPAGEIRYTWSPKR